MRTPVFKPLFIDALMFAVALATGALALSSTWPAALLVVCVGALAFFALVPFCDGAVLDAERMHALWADPETDR